jgi:hypothetical protein
MQQNDNFSKSSEQSKNYPSKPNELTTSNHESNQLPTSKIDKNNFDMASLPTDDTTSTHTSPQIGYETKDGILLQNQLHATPDDMLSDSDNSIASTSSEESFYSTFRKNASHNDVDTIDTDKIQEQCMPPETNFSEYNNYHIPKQQSSSKIGNTTGSFTKLQSTAAATLSSTLSTFVYMKDLLLSIFYDWIQAQCGGGKQYPCVSGLGEDDFLVQPITSLALEFLHVMRWENTLCGQLIPIMQSILHALGGQLVNRYSFW